MSKVIQFDRTGSAEVLKVVERELPLPKAGEVLVKIHISALNRFEIMYRQGEYAYPPQFPSTIGAEAVGTIEKLGEGVTDFSVGDRVSILYTANMIANGTHAEHTIVPVDVIVPAPDTDDTTAASLWTSYVTAYAAFVEKKPIQPKQTAVITAASSSSGLAGIQVVKALGGVAIATTRTSKKKQALLDLGADYVIATEEEDLTTRILELTHGKGADIVYDPIAGEMLPKLLAATAKGGTVYEYGTLDGGSIMTPLPVSLPLLFDKWLTGIYVFDIALDRDRWTLADKWIRDALSRGAIKPIVDRTFKLNEIVEAQRYMEAGNQIGKILVRP
jgi:NADPH:quinone reductase-like Zn-dependent oxidoreductase